VSVAFISHQSLSKNIAAAAMDILGAVVNRNELLPPFSMRRLVGEPRWQISGRDFVNTGRDFVDKLVQDAGLTPDTRVLDLGSGCGRIAIPLTNIIGKSGRYVGLEPKRPLVLWCQREITRACPNFQFLHCDLYNSLYNPRGTIKADSLTFPFEDNQFNLVVATSLFTHLEPLAARNYISEASRVLEPGGRVFATFFLLENGTRSADGSLDFRHSYDDDGNVRVIDTVVPERAVAYATDWLLSVFQACGLRLIPPVRLGSWTGRQAAYSGQDVLIVEKE
jgi:ubiquinone/menaquinone biosynthesis C-methylase UbiE